MCQNLQLRKNKKELNMNKLLRKFSVYDLLVISILATVGIAIKPVVVPLAHIVSGPLMIPGGALAGGLYMLWMIIAYGIVGKPGTASLLALVQALLVMFTGVIGSHGILSLFTYTMPGIAVDLFLLIVGHRICCRSCAFFAGAIANTTGTACVNVVFFQVPGIYLALILSIAFLSGAMGGLLAWQLLKILGDYKLLPNRGKTESRRSTKPILIITIALLIAVPVFAYVNASNSEDSADGYSLTVSREGKIIDTYSFDEIMAMKSVDVKKEILSAKHADESGTFRGVPLEEILNHTDPEIMKECTKFISRAGDSYSSALSLEDLNETANVLVVYEKDGKKLKPFKEGGSGPMRLIIMSDTYGNRCTKYLIGIDCR